MKNSNIYKFIQVGFITTALFGFTLTAGATGTWTEAPSGAATAPTGNVDAPINVGATGQVKSGSLSVGESAMSSSGTTAGLDFEVGGAAAVTGLANWGKSALTGHVDIGVAPTATYRNVGSYTPATGLTTSSYTIDRSAMPTVSLPQYFAYNVSHPTLAVSSDTSFFGRVFSSLRQTFASLFSSDLAYASIDHPAGSSGSIGCTQDSDCDDATVHDGYCVVTNGYGDCHWPSHSGQCGATMDCNSEQLCSDPTSPSNSGVCYTPVAPVDSPSVGADVGSTATRISTPVVTMTPAKSVISSGASDSITWSVTGAASCIVSSTTTDSANSWTSLSPALNSAGAASGTKSFSTFTNYGTNFYTITCQPKGPGEIATQTVSITVGSTYILNVFGNASYNGYVDVTGNLNVGHKITSNGKAVCLADGTNCPPDPAMVLPDLSDDAAGTVTVTDASDPQMAFAHTGVSSGWMGVSGSDLVIAKESTSSILFKTGSTYPTGVSTGTERMRIDGSTGRVGINTTTPGATLDVNGPIYSIGESHFATAGTTYTDPRSGVSYSIKANSIAAGDLYAANHVAVYSGCSGSDHLLYKDNGSGGGCSVFGYLMHP